MIISSRAAVFGKIVNLQQQLPAHLLEVTDNIQEFGIFSQRGIVDVEQGVLCALTEMPMNGLGSRLRNLDRRLFGSRRSVVANSPYGDNRGRPWGRRGFTAKDEGLRFGRQGP